MSSSPAEDQLFPLRLTPFEYYYWCDDRREYRTVFPIQLELEGSLSRDAFTRALHLAWERHPLLRARVDGGVGRIPAWVLLDNPGLPLVWTDGESAGGEAAASRMDLSQGPGLSVAVTAETQRAHVRFTFHHACCDAAGGLQFIEDLLVAYHGLVAGRPAAELWRPLEPARLRCRGYYGLTEAQLRPSLRDRWTILRTWYGLLRRQSAVVAAAPGSAGVADRPLGEPRSDFATGVLAADDVRRLRQVAHQRGATLNDLLLRDLFLTLRDWNRQQGQRERGPLRINMPTSLRGRSDRALPAANVLAFTFPSRHAAECDDPVRLLESIRQETQRIRQQRAGLYFIGGLAFASRLPGVVPWALRHQASFATAVFSNVGRIFSRTPLPRRDGRLVCGELTLRRLVGVPPLRPGTRAAVAVVEYGDETTVNLLCDRRWFGPAQSAALLDLYLGHLRTSWRPARS